MNNFIKKFVITTMYLSLILIATVPSVITSAKQNDIVIRDLTEEEQALIESGEIVPTVVDDIDAFFNITASGVLSYYIIVDGVGKVAEDNVLVIFPFYARAE